MTGRYPARLGLQHDVIGDFQDYGLPLDEVTIADKLKDAGYATHAVGDNTHTALSLPSTLVFSHPHPAPLVRQVAPWKLQLRIHTHIPQRSMLQSCYSECLSHMRCTPD